MKVGGAAAKAKVVIGDPSYFTAGAAGVADDEARRLRRTGKVIRSICFLNHKIPRVESSSAQIILPQKWFGRKSDIYISMISSDFKASDTTTLRPRSG